MSMLREFFRRHPIDVEWLIIIVALYLAMTQNFSFLSRVRAGLPAELRFGDGLFIVALTGALLGVLTLVLGVLSLPKLVKPLLAGLLLAAAACSYFMDSFGVVIDQSMMANAFETDRREAGELLCSRFVLHLVLQGVLPAVLVMLCALRQHSPGRQLAQRLGLIVAALALIGACVGLQYKQFSLWGREHRDVRYYVNPTYPVYSTFRYLRSLGPKPPPQALRPVAADASRPAGARQRPLQVVLVVGETARAANFQIFGYARPTNPELGAMNDIVSFANTYSCGTATAESLPCMFSALGREDFNKRKASEQQNVLDVLARVGIDVEWFDNNSGCKGVCERVDSRSFEIADDRDGLCASGECFDEILLRSLDGGELTAAVPQLLVLHQKGSHGPGYHARYPQSFRQFVPDCVDDSVQLCSREQITNAYDNTIRYTDHVLAGIISKLRARQADVDSVVLYVSDHGESLGENGIYLHGLPYALAPEEQKHVPMLAWFSGQASTALGLDLSCIRAAAGRAYSHDNLFSTLLGLFDVSTRDYVPAQDMFRQCRADR